MQKWKGPGQNSVVFLSLTHTCLWICFVCVLALWLPPSPSYIFAVLYVVFWIPNRHPEFLMHPSKNLHFGSNKSWPNVYCIEWKWFALTTILLPSLLVLVECHFWFFFNVNSSRDSFDLMSWCKGPIWAGAKHNESRVNRWTWLQSIDHAQVWVLRAELTGGNVQMSVCTVVRGTYHC